MLTFDLSDLLYEVLTESNRPPDGKLHPSGDLIGSLRHAQLRAAGAPTREATADEALIGLVRLWTGTMWHSFLESVLRREGRAVMTEVRLDSWLPTGWSGTADWIVWNEEYRAFVLGDLKTIKGEGMPWIARDGIKAEHLWQLSAYWYALEQIGIPLVKGFVVYYLPQNVPTDNPGVTARMLEGAPLDRALVVNTMRERWDATEAYLTQVENYKGSKPENEHLIYLNKSLAPVQERGQAVRWNKTGGVFDLKLVPHWSTAYCPYPDELCDCSTQGQTKIGHYDLEGAYHPRKGYEEVVPLVVPKHRQESAKST